LEPVVLWRCADDHQIFSGRHQTWCYHSANYLYYNFSVFGMHMGLMMTALKLTYSV